MNERSRTQRQVKINLLLLKLAGSDDLHKKWNLKKKELHVIDIKVSISGIGTYWDHIK